MLMHLSVHHSFETLLIWAAVKCSFACLCFVWGLAVSCCNWSLFDYQAIVLSSLLGQDKENQGERQRTGEGANKLHMGRTMVHKAVRILFYFIFSQCSSNL